MSLDSFEKFLLMFLITNHTCGCMLIVCMCVCECIFMCGGECMCNILNSDPAVLSNKKCTSVNNRRIRSKISGDTLTVDGLNWVLSRRSLKQVAVKQLYNPVLQEVRVSWRSEFAVSGCSSKQGEPDSAESWALRSPRVEQPHWMRKKCCNSQKSWGSICCSLRSVSNSPLTYNPFATFSNKGRGMFF